MVQIPPPFDPAELTVRQLLASSVAVIDELLRRELIRTRNAPLGDLAESLALRAYGGTLAPNSEKSYDLLTPDGTRVQVKARMVQPSDARPQAFSAVRSWDFDLALFMLFDAGTYDLTWARELTREEAEPLGRRVEHTNSWAVLVRQVEGAGGDVTERLADAYGRLDEPRVEDQR
ncbi:hypothetical protein GCM10017714_13360 [Curtobacterium pusillum]|uniref:DUF6998 domain-containing protein n=1 Tax=Curtobacterium pusillum TaxID=69373 RepID=A0ABX2M4S9_9MICO|nr:hypothetical protein [Curtobacterium pusillum]NUU13125.1 hypothetical protein [Curtobacterium pusillum]GLK30597.1 hypothetical protein GCM10017610_08820 [Curtobacterium pusillum]